jgi:hypothetical protein
VVGERGREGSVRSGERELGREALVREASRAGLCAARVVKSCGMVGG